MRTSSIRIATYNIQKCVGLDLRRRPDRCLQVINALDADIVVLQEADKRLPPRPAALPHDMAEKSGWRIVPFGAPGGSLGWHGNAMLIRGNIHLQKTSHLKLPGLEPRGAILAEFATKNSNIRILGMHLGLIRRYRLLQVAAVMRALKHCAPLPTILAGDFNEWGKGTALEAATQGFSFVKTDPSFPSPRPIARLDRFALSSDLTAIDAGTHFAQPAKIASDHLPVWIDAMPCLAPHHSS